MSRVQFYSCLKFIAAYQAGIPLRHELLASIVALPLPKFSWNSPIQNTETEINGRNDMNRSSSINELVRENLNNATNSDNMTSTDSEVEQNDGQSHERNVSDGNGKILNYENCKQKKNFSVVVAHRKLGVQPVIAQRRQIVLQNVRGRKQIYGTVCYVKSNDNCSVPKKNHLIDIVAKTIMTPTWKRYTR